jgi:hypothetical protein
LELENKKLGVDMVQKMSLRGWVIALIVHCLLVAGEQEALPGGAAQSGQNIEFRGE